jgi:sulfatase maturation enzyme AslB (radical SAM superfamily)
MEKLVCTYQQNHLAITQPEGKISPCCHFDTSVDPHWDQVNLNSINSLSGLLKSYRWYDLREKFSEGVKYEGCKNCWKSEKIGYLSKREYYNYVALENHQIQVIEDLELSLDFSCNFMCRSCRPGISSTWNKATSVIQKLKEFEHDHYEPLSINNYSKKIKTLLENSDLSNLKRVAIVGGEPFLSRNLKWFLNKLDLKNIYLKITTNGSVFPDDELLRLLYKCKKVYLDISIDAVEELAEVMRFGAPWKMIVKNIERFLKTDFVIKLVTTVSIMNINKLQSILEFSRHYGSPQTCYSLFWPSYLKSNMVPLNMRKQWKINLPKKLNTIYFMSLEQVYDDVRDFNTIILDKEQSENKLLEFVKSMNHLDEYQKRKFSDVNPEIWELAHTCKRVKNYYA